MLAAWLTRHSERLFVRSATAQGTAKLLHIVLRAGNVMKVAVVAIHLLQQRQLQMALVIFLIPQDVDAILQEKAPRLKLPVDANHKRLHNSSN